MFQSFGKYVSLLLVYISDSCSSLKMLDLVLFGFSKLTFFFFFFLLGLAFSWREGQPQSHLRLSNTRFNVESSMEPNSLVIDLHN